MGAHATLPVQTAEDQIEIPSQMQMPRKMPYHKHIGIEIMPWLTLHYPMDSAFNGRIFIGRKKEGIMCTVSRRNIVEIPYFVPQMHISKVCDYYITANAVSGVVRQKKDLFSLHNIVVDIDCHADGVPYELIANELVARCHRDLFNCGAVPTPNSIVYTGRGVQFWWALKPAAKALAFLYQRAQAWLIEQFELLIKEYPSSLSELSVDSSASRNIVGYYRLPLTYNTTTNRKGSYELLHTNQYKLTDLVEDFVPTDFSEARFTKKQFKDLSISNTEQEYDITLSKNDVIVFEGGTNAMARRVLKMVELRAFRNAPINEEMRDLFCFVVYCALLSIYDQDEAWRRLLAFNEGFKEPLDIKELEQSMAATEKHRYSLSNEKIIEKLNITPEEQVAIGLQGCAKKPSNYTRDLLRQKKKQARNNEIMALHNTGMSQAQIAKEMQLSRNTVAKVLRDAEKHATDLPEPSEEFPLAMDEPKSAVPENSQEEKSPKIIMLNPAQAQPCSNLVPKYSFVSYSEAPAKEVERTGPIGTKSLNVIRPPT